MEGLVYKIRDDLREIEEADQCLLEIATVEGKSKAELERKAVVAIEEYVRQHGLIHGDIYGVLFLSGLEEFVVETEITVRARRSGTPRSPKKKTRGTRGRSRSTHVTERGSLREKAVPKKKRKR